MEMINKSLRILFNVQILSALIWAIAIMACSYVSVNNDVATILIIGAGFHVVLLSRVADKKTENCESVV